MGGEVSFELGWQIAEVPEPTLKRLRKFQETASAIERIIDTETYLPRYRAAWCLLHHVLNRAFDFDVRVLHQAAFGHIAIEADQRVEAIAAKILGDASAVNSKVRLRLHCEHGGAGLVSIYDKSTCGYLMAARQVAPGVRQRLVAEGQDATAVGSAIALRVLPGCQACQASLAARGLHLRRDGGISRAVEGATDVSSWLSAGSASKQACALRLLSEIRAEIHADELSERAQLLAAGGEGAGCWHNDLPATWQRPVWSDPVFRVPLRFRLGLPVLPQPRAGDDLKKCACGKELDPLGWHVLLCNRGPWTCARHNALVRVLASIAKEAGYVALVEQHVPQLGFRTRRRNGIEITEAARLDVACSCHPMAADRLFDVSVRNVSVRNLERCSTHRGSSSGFGD